MGASREEEYLKSVLDNYHIGAVRYNPGKAEEVYEQNRILQENSKIPLLIAANTEAGEMVLVQMEHMLVMRLKLLLLKIHTMLMN